MWNIKSLYIPYILGDISIVFTPCVRFFDKLTKLLLTNLLVIDCTFESIY